LKEPARETATDDGLYDYPGELDGFEDREDYAEDGPLIGNDRSKAP
jgi:hypothetical protein